MTHYDNCESTDLAIAVPIGPESRKTVLSTNAKGCRLASPRRHIVAPPRRHCGMRRYVWLLALLLGLALLLLLIGGEQPSDLLALGRAVQHDFWQRAV